MTASHSVTVQRDFTFFALERKFRKNKVTKLITAKLQQFAENRNIKSSSNDNYTFADSDLY